MGEKCGFRGGYRDLDSKAMLQYKCERTAGPSGRCVFHDGISHIEDEEAVRGAFLEELGDPNCDGLFIGCNIPAVGKPISGSFNALFFSRAVFHGPVSFTNIRMDTVDFSDAQFCGNLVMKTCDVSLVIFKDSRFGNYSDEDDVCPEGTTAGIKLVGCKFKELDMSWSFFTSPAEMSGCEFGRSTFIGCEFKESLSVDWCTFKDGANFRRASFLAASKFTDTFFTSGALFRESNFESHMDFHRVDFQDQRRVTMPINMSDVSLLGTDIERVRFGAGTVWETKDGMQMFDVRNVKDGSRTSLIEAVSVCRNLRENYDYHMAYADAAKFFEWEMELQRKYRDVKGVVCRKNKLASAVSLRYLYKKTSDYGESINKIMVMWAVLISSSFVYFCTFPDAGVIKHIESLGGCWYGEPCDHHPVPVAVFYRVLEAMGRADQSEPAGLVFHAATLLVLGMSFIAVRRRLERRLRH